MKLEATDAIVRHDVTQRVSAGVAEIVVESTVHRDFDSSPVVGRLSDPVEENVLLRFIVDVARRRQCVSDKRSMFRQNHAVDAVLSPAETFNHVHSSVFTAVFHNDKTSQLTSSRTPKFQPLVPTGARRNLKNFKPCDSFLLLPTRVDNMRSSLCRFVAVSLSFCICCGCIYVFQ